MTPTERCTRLLERVASSLRSHLRIPLFANAYALMTNQVFAAGLGFLYWFLAARLYSDAVVGGNSAAISTILYMAALAEMSLKSAMTRFVPRAGLSTPRFVGTAFGINIILSFLVSLFLVTAGKYIPLTASLLNSVRVAPLWLVLATIFWSISYIQDGVLIGMRRSKWVLAKNVLFNGLKLVLLVVFAHMWPEYGLFASWFIVVPVVVLAAAYLIFYRFMPAHLALDFSQTKAITRSEFIKSTSGDYIGGLLAETSTRLLPLLVLHIFGESFTAYYYQAWNISRALLLLATSMTTSFTVEASANMSLLTVHTRRILRQMVTLLVPVVLVLWLGAPLVLGLLGENYALESVGLLRWLVVSTLPYIFSSWYLSYSLVFARVKIIILIQGMQLIVTLVISYLFLPVYGLVGIGMAWFLAQSLAAIPAVLKLLQIFSGKGDSSYFIRS